MSNRAYRERPETEPASDSGYEADGLELIIHTSSIRVEYYRSFKYSLKWEAPMHTRRSSRQLKASKKSPERSPDPDEEVIQRKFKGKRQRTGLRMTKADNSVVSTDHRKDRDLIDVISSTDDAKQSAEKDEETFVEVTDEGVDKSAEEDCISVTSSIASGPSHPHNLTPKKQSPLPSMCSACWRLYQKARKMKAPIKDKLFDNDPKSLTCDQWVLIKSWRPRRLPDTRGKLLNHIQLVQKQLQVKNAAGQTEQCVTGGEPTACSRSHTFLRRNLRRRVRVSAKKDRKKKRAKRGRDDSQGPRVAKQQRLHSDNHLHHVSTDGTNNDNSLHLARHERSSPGWEQEVDDPADVDLTVELIPSRITLETTVPKKVPPKKRTPKKTGGFRELLAQLRGNNSMIVREKC